MDKFSFFAEIQVTNLSSWQPHATLSIQEDVSLLLSIFYVVCGLPLWGGGEAETKPKWPAFFSPSYSFLIAPPNLLYIPC